MESQSIFQLTTKMNPESANSDRDHDAEEEVEKGPEPDSEILEFIHREVATTPCVLQLIEPCANLADAVVPEPCQVRLGVAQTALDVPGDAKLRRRVVKRPRRVPKGTFGPRDAGRRAGEEGVLDDVGAVRGALGHEII